MVQLGKVPATQLFVGKHVGHQVFGEEDEAGVALVSLVFVNLDKIIKSVHKWQKCFILDIKVLTCCVVLCNLCKLHKV